MTALSNKFKVLIVKIIFPLDWCEKNEEGVKECGRKRLELARVECVSGILCKERDENSTFLQALKQVRNLCVNE